MKAVEKAVLLTAVVLAIALAVMLLKPFSLGEEYWLKYCRERGKELAEAIEARSLIRLSEDLFVKQARVIIEVVKPFEERLAIRIVYSKLLLKAPHSPLSLVRGSSLEKPFEYTRRVSVYHNGPFVIVDPKPIVHYSLLREYGRRVHLVLVVVFRVFGEPVKGMVLEFANSTLSIHYRAYDYSGVAEVLVNGAKAYSLNIGEEDIVRLVIAREVWGVRS